MPVFETDPPETPADYYRRVVGETDPRAVIAQTVSSRIGFVLKGEEDADIREFLVCAVQHAWAMKHFRKSADGASGEPVPSGLVESARRVGEWASNITARAP